ncbi:hypothetical protein MTR_3g104790 [Medicago truncatula]|uniref:DYW domain-containing protein n=1 Tax=Medicago truncatula TaxID=3880 RepID=G7J8C8_MEDTR|nr:hypothetical protein MTR_3g104790 [Medicago truncatula]
MERGEGIKIRIRKKVPAKKSKGQNPIAVRHGNGVWWGRVLPSPSPYPILIYLPITLLISNGNEKLNLIPVPDGFRDLNALAHRLVGYAMQVGCKSWNGYAFPVIHHEKIARDTNRFHHFKDGFCSCNDALLCLLFINNRDHLTGIGRKI